MGKIYITRHGETEWNTVKRMQGQNNSPLTELGRKQATWLYNRLKETKIDIVYSSSLPRALETAYLLKGERDIDVVSTDALQEIYLGSWQGCLASEVEKNFPEQHRCFWYEPESYVPVDGESFDSLITRVSEWFQEILEKNADKNILIVSHAIVLKALINYINRGEVKTLWEGPHFKPTSLTIIEHNNNQFNIELLADTTHYEEVNPNGWFMDEHE